MISRSKEKPLTGLRKEDGKKVRRKEGGQSGMGISATQFPPSPTCTTVAWVSFEGFAKGWAALN